MFKAPLPATPSRALSWVGTALPIGICASIWLLGTEVRWLATLHHMIGVAALAWTGLRLARRPSLLRPAQIARTLGDTWAKADSSIIFLYALLMLQPVLEIAGRALAGCGLVVCGVAVLPANASLAQDIVRVHGFNALLLLVLIGAQIVRELVGRFGVYASSSSIGLGQGRAKLR
jgi:cytochrome b561